MCQREPWHYGVGILSQDAAFRSRRIVLLQGRDAIEKAGSTGIVEHPRRQRSRLFAETAADLAKECVFSFEQLS
jgi:hypothetical protein